MKSSIFHLAVFLSFAAYECNAEIFNVTTAIDACLRSWFPRDVEFNEQCLLDGCPALKDFSLCPNTMTNDQLKQFTSIIGGCMAKPVCGITMEPRPIPPMTVSIDSLIPGTFVTAQVVVIPETSRLQQLSNIQLELSPTQEQQPAAKLTLPDLRVIGDLEMQLVLKAPLIPALTVSLRKVSADVHVPFTSAVTFTRQTTANETNFDTQLTNSTLKANFQLEGLVLPKVFPKLESMIENNAETAIEDSNFANDAGAFYQKLLQAAFQTVSKCN